MDFNVEALEREGIQQWATIKDSYENCPILLGNGFSLNFSQTLQYKKLYDHFILGASVESKSLFGEFETNNFETILQHLDSTERVNAILGNTDSNTQTVKDEVRQGLINSIHRIHPKPDQINQNQLMWVASQFKRFSNIYTTNYDLFLYYIILETGIFGDYFYYKFLEDNNYNLFNAGDSRNDHHIYYLHGALFIFERGVNTIKIKKDTDHWLLDKVTSEIENSNYPVFVSEGTSESKLKSIQANGYLSYCLRNFSESEEQELVIYGQSLSEQDHHLVNRIDGIYKKIAISIRPQSWSNIRALRAEKSRISSLFKKSDFVFFDSNSLFDFEPKFQIQ